LEISVRTKNFNSWVSTSNVWIPDYKVMECMRSLTTEDMKADWCYVGIDLSSVRDLTAISYMVFKDGKYYFKTDYYLPEDTITEGISRNTYLYKQWAEKGWLKLTEGNTVDYSRILEDILRFNKDIPCYKLLYDQWNSSSFIISAIEKGLNMVPFSQTISNFNKPCKECERLIYQGDVIIDSNPITRFCFNNVVLKIDPINENQKPTKASKENKIDGCISMLEALGGYLEDFSADISIVSGN